MINKKAEFDLILGILYLALIILFLFIGSLAYYDFIFENECLESIAKEICLEQEKIFDGFTILKNKLFTVGFRCRFIRATSSEVLRFTETELRSCGE